MAIRTCGQRGLRLPSLRDATFREPREPGWVLDGEANTGVLPSDRMGGERLHLLHQGRIPCQPRLRLCAAGADVFAHLHDEARRQGKVSAAA